MAQLTVYLAGPMDDISHEEAHLWRVQLALAFPRVLFFDPTDAWLNAGMDTAEAVDHGNRVMLWTADGVLANLGGPGRGFGTVREIEFARSRGKPVAVAIPEPLVSLLSHDVLQAPTVEEAMELLLGVIADERAARPGGLMGFLLQQSEEGEGGE